MDWEYLQSVDLRLAPAQVRAIMRALAYYHSEMDRAEKKSKKPDPDRAAELVLITLTEGAIRQTIRSLMDDLLGDEGTVIV